MADENTRLDAGQHGAHQAAAAPTALAWYRTQSTAETLSWVLAVTGVVVVTLALLTFSAAAEQPHGDVGASLIWVGVGSGLTCLGFLPAMLLWGLRGMGERIAHDLAVASASVVDGTPR